MGKNLVHLGDSEMPTPFRTNGVPMRRDVRQVAVCIDACRVRGELQVGEDGNGPDRDLGGARSKANVKRDQEGSAYYLSESICLEGAPLSKVTEEILRLKKQKRISHMVSCNVQIQWFSDATPDFPATNWSEKLLKAQTNLPKPDPTDFETAAPILIGLSG